VSRSFQLTIAGVRVGSSEDPPAWPPNAAAAASQEEEQQQQPRRAHLPATGSPPHPRHLARQCSLLLPSYRKALGVGKGRALAGRWKRRSFPPVIPGASKSDCELTDRGAALRRNPGDEFVCARVLVCVCTGGKKLARRQLADRAPGWW
jgi:hypothetical protein